MKLITILIPAYNEEEVLHQLYFRLNEVINKIEGYKFEMLFVNDGSKDRTLSIIKDMRKADARVSYLDLSRNFGKETAMLAGFDHAQGDALIIIDADLQDPPELIPQMIEYWEQGYDDVFAKRNSRTGETWFKKWTSKTFYRILQKASRITIEQDTGDFRLLDKRCVAALRKMRETQRYTKGMFSWIGFHKKEILFDRDPRAAGTTKWNYSKLFDLAIEGITSFTTVPLRISSFVGFTVSMLAFVYILFIVFKTIFFGESITGYPSTMSVILFLGGVQMLSLGVIGEYLGRIFNETKNRPLYFKNDYNGDREGILPRHEDEVATKQSGEVEKEYQLNGQK